MGREDKGSPRKGHDGSSKKQQNRRKRKNSESSEQEEEQEDCSANPKCQRPTGKEVHWVQCDGCELWFHLHCIGLKPEQVSEDEDFICKTCKPNRQNQRKEGERLKIISRTQYQLFIMPLKLSFLKKYFLGYKKQMKIKTHPKVQ